MTRIREVSRLLWPALIVLSIIWAGPLYGQTSPPAAPGGTAAEAQAPLLSDAQLEQLTAQVALYPDSLLAQILMASTYPLEVVSAARWLKSNSGLSGDARDQALAQENWDPSVKSLIAFPQVLQMMNDQIDWTEQLGDAFLAQQNDLMKAVQRLRAKAQAAGNLKSGPQQTVTVAPSAGSPDSPSSEVIVIQPTQPDVVYVPSYNPTVVYGPWPYPAYQPTAWYPPGYVASNVVSFGLGLAVGGFFWGDCDWHTGHVDVNVNNYNNFVNRFPGPHPGPPGPYPGPGPHPYPGPGPHPGFGPGPHPGDNGRVPWNHDPDHRRGVPYANHNVQNQYMGRRQVADEKAREQFRGHADQQRAGLAGLDPKKLPAANGGRMQQLSPRHQQRLGGGGAGERQIGPAGRPAVHRQPARPNLAGRPAGAGHADRAFSQIGSGGQAWHDSARGRQSLQHLAAPAGGLGHGGGNISGFHGGGAFHGGGGFQGGGGFHGGGGLRRR